MTTETRDAVSNVETEYLEINSRSAWSALYQHIRNECTNFDYTCNESKKPQNKNLNRYMDVAPYDHSRIVLANGPCDYINANLVKVDLARRQYILTQGPLPNTTSHFWLMIWEQNSKAILMLNKVYEKNMLKCHQYWPTEDSTNPTMVFPDVNLEVEYISKINSSDYTTRTLRLTDVQTKESRDVLHFHYTTWPDFGVPKSPTAFLRFLADVRRSGALDQNVGPPIVHCSAGIGRSGTFCLVDTCLVLIEENGLNSVNVRDVLLDMRRSRMGLIQTPEQLRFSYAAIIEGHKHMPSNNGNLDNGSGTIENHYDVVSNINNSSVEEEDDGPPPLPPPRGESLSRRIVPDATPSPDAENENGTGPPNKPLPMEPPTLNSNNHHDACFNKTGVSNDGSGLSSDGMEVNMKVSDCSMNDTKKSLRHRNPDKNERLAAQLKDMKRRQDEAEDWQKLKRSLFKPIVIGIGVVLIGGGVVGGISYLYLRP